jgi:RNA polymerase sigma-70 factor (ECF subfamily)
VTGYDLSGDWDRVPASREVLDAQRALRDGLNTLRDSVHDAVHDAMHSAFSVRFRGSGSAARTRNKPHTNDPPGRQQQPPGNAAKPAGTRRPIPAQGAEGGVATPETGSEDPTVRISYTPTADGAVTQVLPPGGGSSPTGYPKRPDPSDAAAEVWALVERAQAGDAQAFGLIYDRYLTTVFRFIYFRVGNRQLAEDLTSDTFLRALKRIGSFTWQGRDVGAWLVTIARNLVADHFKSGRYRLEVTTGDVLDADREDRGPEGSPEAAVVDHITNVALLTAVKQLNAEQQECIVLRFLQGFSVAETARAMGKNEGAVKALQYRAVRALHRLLPEGFQS